MSPSDAKQMSEVGGLGVEAPPRIMGPGADPEAAAKAKAPPEVEAEVMVAALAAPLSHLCHLKSVTITMEVSVSLMVVHGRISVIVATLHIVSFTVLTGRCSLIINGHRVESTPSNAYECCALCTNEFLRKS